MILAFAFLFAAIWSPAVQAEWLQNGKPVTNCPYAKTQGEFGAMLFFTDKPDEVFKTWNIDGPGVNINPNVEEMKKDESLVALIMFSNCTPDSKGNANVSVKFTVLDPEGKVLINTKELEVWINKPAPLKRDLGLSVQYITIGVGRKQPAGVYTVNAIVHDKNSNTELNLERHINILE